MLFIVGPTAVGKTEIAAEVAARIDAEIINADALQIYDGLKILNAQPEPALLAKARHHLIGEVPLSRAFDVAQFLEMARTRAQEIAARGKKVLIVGGTGLYVRALTHGLADLPSADPRLRAELETVSLDDLQKRYTDLDPVGAAQIDLKNQRRLVRALEVCLLTGRPFSSFRTEWNPVCIIHTGFLLTRERADLYARIDQRVVTMFNNGLLDEVRTVGEISATAAQMIGFREARDCARGALSESEAIARIQQATRHYAKRQLTWFRRELALTQLNLTTLSPAAAVQIIVERALGTCGVASG